MGLMVDRPGVADEIQQRDRKITRRTIFYGIYIVLTVALLIVVLVWLSSRRGECLNVSTLVCSPEDRRLLVFLPCGVLLLGSAGAFLRASPRWHRLRRMYIRPYMAWFLAGLAVGYGVVSFSFLS